MDENKKTPTENEEAKCGSDSPCKSVEHLGDAAVHEMESEWLKDAQANRADKAPSKVSEPTVSSGQDTPSSPESSHQIRDLDPTVGIAFSGGGVRSATFNLGVLQALADWSVLRRVGYISSVSGGSYINCWLASWLQRDHFQAVSDALAEEEGTAGPQGAGPVAGGQQRYREQQPISHLRKYSSYLTPQKGWLSSDVWALAAAYVLRLGPNVAFVLLAASGVIGLPYVQRNFVKFVANPVAMQAAVNYESNLKLDMLDQVRALGGPSKGGNIKAIFHDRDDAFYKALEDADSLSGALSATCNCDDVLRQKVEAVHAALVDYDRFHPDAVQESGELTASTHALAEATSHSERILGDISSDDFGPRSRLRNSVERFKRAATGYRAEPVAARTAIGNLQCSIDHLSDLSGHDLGDCEPARLKEQCCDLNHDPAARPQSHLEVSEDEFLSAFRTNVQKDLSVIEAAHALAEEPVPPSTDSGSTLSLSAPRSDADRIWRIVDSADKLEAFRRLAPRGDAKNAARRDELWGKLCDKLCDKLWGKQCGKLCERILLWVLLLVCFLGLYLFWAKIWGPYDPSRATKSRGVAAWHGAFVFVALLFMVPLLTSMGIYFWAWWCQGAHPSSAVGWGSLSFALLALAAGCVCLNFEATGIRAAGFSASIWNLTFAFVASTLAGTLGYGLTAWGLGACFHFADRYEVGFVLAAVLGPIGLLVAYVAMASAGILFLSFDPESQEWLNRIWGSTAMCTMVWTVTGGIALLWPLGLIALRHCVHGIDDLPNYTVILGWAVTTLSGILSANSAKTSGMSTADTKVSPWRVRMKASRNQFWFLDILARSAPICFVLGILLLLSGWIHHDSAWRLWQHLPAWTVPIVPLVLTTICAALCCWLGRQIDVNRLSLHNVYRFRLIEAYLAAINPATAEDRKVADIQPSSQSEYDGPFPIINCTLNVTKSGQLDLQNRRARSFVFTPTASGFTRYDSVNRAIALAEENLDSNAMIPTSSCASVRVPALRLKNQQGEPDSITLGAAMAISGAAQSPNEGSHTSPAVAALLTLANIRLGWWIGNPRRTDTCCRYSPTNGLWPMLDELMAQTTDESKYVYLSDGGHFENLGIYELVRRRCKVIIVGDADCDPNYQFEDLVNAIALCRMDFGVEITIQTDPLLNTLKSHYSRTAFTLGTIDYGDGCPGTLIYLKPAVTRDNSLTVLKYDRDSPSFPHEPTENQWFDEPQFEAYRLLGRETAHAAMSALADGPDKPPAWWLPGNAEGDTWRLRTQPINDYLGAIKRRDTSSPAMGVSGHGESRNEEAL